MTLPPNTFRYPFALADQPHEVQQAHIFAFNAVLDLQNAIKSLKGQLDAKTTTTITSASSSSGSGVIPVPTPFPGLGAVRDLTGSTSYTVLAADNGILLILSDSSSVTLTLDSAMTTPYFLFASNFGAGLVTFTPTSGTINGAATFTLSTGYVVQIVFDGTNWKTSSVLVIPQNTPAVLHEWLASYNSSTGVFTQTQPAFTDISGSLATGQLPASVPVVSFGSGAPAGSSTEGYIYFDTSGSPYHGYVFHSSAWHQFS